MEPAEGTEPGIVAQLDDLGPVRLAALLRAVRKQRMQSRREVATRVGTSANMLRRCERGDSPVPRDMIAALAAYYGEDLTARFETHAPARVDRHAAALATEEVHPRAGPVAADPAAEPSELAVETLLADLALARLGTVLRSTREEHSESRRDVASRIGTTARELRRYETGATAVPHGVLTALAEFYGNDLDTHFAHRTPIPADPSRVVDKVEEAQAHSGDGDEALGAYVGIVRRLPDPESHEPLTLRAADMAVLSTALAVEPEHVKGRIAELLARTTRLRRHDQIRRRKRIVSGAGLGIVFATIAGFGTGALVAALPSNADPVTSTVTAPSTTGAATSTSVAEPQTTVAVPVTLPPVLPGVDETTTTVVVTPVPTTEPPTTTSVVIGSPITVLSPPTTTTFPRPVISTDTTPMSVPGTEPVTIFTVP